MIHFHLKVLKITEIIFQITLILLLGWMFLEGTLTLSSLNQPLKMSAKTFGFNFGLFVKIMYEVGIDK